MTDPASESNPGNSGLVELDQRTLDFIDGIAAEIHHSITSGELPAIEVLVRGLKNVTYDSQKGYLKLGDAHKHRTLNVNTVRAFAQTLRLMATSRTMIQSNDFATKREAYYVSKNWGECRFDGQNESDAIMDDIEAMASMHGRKRSMPLLTASA